MDVGPIEVGTERGWFVPPAVGGIAMVVGVVMLVAVGRTKR